MGESVKLHGIRFSPFSARVEIALKMKGVEYEFIGEDLGNKSEELLKYNPIHKKIPVLVHGGKPIAESLVILEYIDETWKGNADLLPSDPYERAQARFWAKFLDEKFMPVMLEALVNSGELSKKAIHEGQELLKFLENEINGKKFFQGNGIGIVDIAAGVILGYWVPVFQEVSGKELLKRENFPAIFTWTDNLLTCNVVNEVLPDREH